MIRLGKVHLPVGTIVIFSRCAATVMVLPPTFMPYEVQTTTRSPCPSPCEAKARAYFSA